MKISDLKVKIENEVLEYELNKMVEVSKQVTDSLDIIMNQTRTINFLNSYIDQLKHEMTEKKETSEDK